MRMYSVYEGRKPDGGSVRVAIDTEAERRPDFQPSQYFPLGVTDIRCLNNIQIDGETNCLAERFIVWESRGLAAYNAFVDILEKALARCHEPNVIKLLEKMFGSIEWEELAALALVNPWTESVTEKYQQEPSMTDEDAMYLRWKYGHSNEVRKLTIDGEDVVNVAEFADGAHSQESWDACQQYIAKLKVNDLMPQVGNVLKSLHGWNLHGCYGRDEIQIIAELRAILSDLIGRIGEEQVKTHFAEMLEEQEQELHAMEVENGCCDCEIDDESEPYCHIFSEEEARAISEN